VVFFNKKEEVLEIELTSFGKSLHSKGRLKPSYYAFFDEDVIYDGAYGSAQTPADTRIRINTPRSKAQGNTSGVEKVEETMREEERISFGLESPTSVFSSQDARDANDETQSQKTKEILIQEQKRRNTFPPIGTSANSTKYHPGWKSYILDGELSSSIPYIDNGGSVINIPQLNLQKRSFTAKAIKGTDDNSRKYGYIFPDGSSVTLEEDGSEFLLFLQESNASSDVENFFIELYEVDEAESGEENLIPLDFPVKFMKDRIVDGIILEDNEPIIGIDVSSDPTMAGYFFDIEADDEIDPSILLKAIQSGRFADIRDLESFANSARFNSDNSAQLTSGNSATAIYGLTHAEIAEMTEEALQNMETSKPGQRNIYNEEDNVVDCD
tara:strand:- start:490 stop:1638 length:1149 start_codon:yes stop_codon:yes gene_type:complete